MPDNTNAVNLIKARIKELPKNTAFDKETAPAERWEALKDVVREIKRDVFQKMTENSKNVYMGQVSDVRENFNELEAALCQSTPIYPSLSKSIDKIQKFANKNNYKSNTSYYVKYFAGSKNDDCLVQYDVDIDSSSGAYELGEDPLGDKVRSLVKGFQNIESYVVKNLKNPESRSDQKANNAVNDSIEELFHEQEMKIAYICGKTFVVKEKGIAAECRYRRPFS